MPHSQPLLDTPALHTSDLTCRIREPCLTLPQPETHLVQHQLLRASRAPRDADGGGGGRGGLVGGGEVDLVVGGAAQAPRG